MTDSTVNFLKLAYGWGWVTKAQLQAAVDKTLTVEQYKQITGEDYEEATS